MLLQSKALKFLGFGLADEVCILHGNRELIVDIHCTENKPACIGVLRTLERVAAGKVSDVVELNFCPIIH